MTKTDTDRTIERLENFGLQVDNWKPGNRRIFKVLDSEGNELSGGMFSEELRAWCNGYSNAPANPV